MARARRHGDLVSRPTLEQGQRSAYCNGARIAAGEIVVSLTYNGISPVPVPSGAGGLLLLYAITRINPEGLFTAGSIVAEVFKFEEGQGVQNVALDADFLVIGANGVRSWAYQAELGLDFDSATPSAPIGTFTATGGSSNQQLETGIHKTFEALVATGGLQLRIRLSHDGAGPISITPNNISVTAFGSASGAPLRLR